MFSPLLGAQSLSSLQFWSSLPLTMSVERRLGTSLWLTGRVAASYWSQTQPVPEPSQTSGYSSLTVDRADEWSVGVGLGARYVLNPGDTVELGPYVELAASTSGTGSHIVQFMRSDFSPSGTIVSNTTLSGRATSFGGAAGLTAEHFFTSHLSLRLQLQVLSGNTSRSAISGKSDDGQSASTSRRAQSLGLDFSPSAQLRLTF